MYAKLYLWERPEARALCAGGINDVCQQVWYRGADCQAESFSSFHGVTALQLKD